MYIPRPLCIAFQRRVVGRVVGSVKGKEHEVKPSMRVFFKVLS